MPSPRWVPPKSSLSFTPGPVRAALIRSSRCLSFYFLSHLPPRAITGPSTMPPFQVRQMGPPGRPPERRFFDAAAGGGAKTPCCDRS